MLHLQVAAALVAAGSRAATVPGAARPVTHHLSGSSACSGLRERAQAAAQAAPYFLLLDWRRVRGLDATAARTFGTLHNTLARMQARLLHNKLATLNYYRPGYARASPWHSGMHSSVHQAGDNVVVP